MKLVNPKKITVLISPEGTEITITDTGSITTLAKVFLTPDQLSACLSRQGFVECECTTGPLERIGKTHENKNFEFEIGEPRKKEDLKAICTKALLDQEMYGWESGDNYGSQNSLFAREGKNYARVIIRRWV